MTDSASPENRYEWRNKWALMVQRLFNCKQNNYCAQVDEAQEFIEQFIFTMQKAQQEILLNEEDVEFEIANAGLDNMSVLFSELFLLGIHVLGEEEAKQRITNAINSEKGFDFRP